MYSIIYINTEIISATMVVAINSGSKLFLYIRLSPEWLRKYKNKKRRFFA